MTVHHIVPPYLLEHLERTADDPNLRARYRLSLQHDAVLRSRPATTVAAQPEGSDQLEADGAGARRVVHDAENGTSLPGSVVRREGDPVVADETVNRAYDGIGATWTMFKECFGRDSIDGAGLPLTSTVHFDRGYANAFWDGAQMVFGDGDGEIFGDFTQSLDVTGHELTHGVTQYAAGLVYEGQSGALSESLSDVFGSLAKQHHLGQSAADADWLIGAELFRPGVSATALRSLKAPGTAYDDPRIGSDPQPAHMSSYLETTDDHGGVHLNSGIPNHAFYLVATELGGSAYEKPGQIWYSTLTSGTLAPTPSFADFAEATHRTATTLYGTDSPEAAAVTTAWQSVGVLTAPDPAPAEPQEQSAESVELMRAANTSLDFKAPPAPPAIPPAPAATSDAISDTSAGTPDTPDAIPDRSDASDAIPEASNTPAATPDTSNTPSEPGTT